MTEKINPENWLFINIYTFEYHVKFSFWASVVHHLKFPKSKNQKS